MAPTLDSSPLDILPLTSPVHDLSKRSGHIGKPTDAKGLILEAWSQGYLIGSLVIMAAITLANMRKGILLHKLILVELIFCMFMGTFIFPNEPVYGWYLSTTAIFLNTGWSLHNVIAWMKTKPFLSRKWSWFYIGTVIIVQPYWVLEIYANFTYFNNINTIFEKTRPYEALFRDPWWIITTILLFHAISSRYDLSIPTVIHISPRFGVLLAAMTLSIIFIILDIISVTSALGPGLPDGLNPFWKLSTVFKCLTDSIILDDFKTALDRLMRHKMRREGMGSGLDGFGTVGSDGANDTLGRDGTGGGRGSGAGGGVGGGLGPPDRMPSDMPVEEDPLHDHQIDRGRTSDAVYDEMARRGSIEAKDIEKGDLGVNGNGKANGTATVTGAAPGGGRRPRASTVVRDYGAYEAKPVATHVDNYDDLDLPDLGGKLK